jgi:hypothetical protein
MRILFLCGSMEPGKDGVGDYCRRLAAELIRNEHSAWIVALNDHHVHKQIEEDQLDKEVKVRVLRLDRETAITNRISSVHNWIQQIKPDWISLQYVPYAFHAKGLPLLWMKHFKRISNACKWHIMFHELWIGSMNDDSMKEKFIGLMQRFIIKRTINISHPLAVTTSITYYQARLKELGQQASILPVFSNLTQGNNNNTNLYTQLPMKVQQNRNEWYIAALFGATHPFFGIEANIAALEQKALAENKKLLLTHIGRSNTILAFFQQIKKVVSCDYHIFGECLAEDIASFFHQIDFGLSTYNNEFLGKSGSIASMLYNGLPVVLLKDCNTHSEYHYAQFVHDIPELSAFCNQHKDWNKLYSVENASAFYSSLFTRHYDK